MIINVNNDGMVGNANEKKLHIELIKKDKEIERLRANYERIYNENCKLRKEHNINDITLLDENERLNNIINELEEELDRGYRDLFEHELVPGRELITNIKNYLQELKGEDNEKH